MELARKLKEEGTLKAFGGGNQVTGMVHMPDLLMHFLPPCLCTYSSGAIQMQRSLFFGIPMSFVCSSLSHVAGSQEDIFLGGAAIE